ncbi:Appr-1-p processing protein [Chloroflexia bacterium SDU3-3]|nr:Appr-1-p processing protein [Chloroflexia bacterium SDU3-3]
MNIILAAVEADLADAFEHFCAGIADVTIHRGSILDLAVDAVVSPANSFGFMDGGIDMLYSRFFGWHVQYRLQQLIQTRHYGELVVGTAEIVPTDHDRIPYLIAAPTMRVPMILRDSVNPYLACRAALLLAKYGTLPDGTAVAAVVQSVAIPGLGTGVGRVSPRTCAYQIRTAIDEVLSGHAAFPSSWHDAQTRHQQLYASSTRDLQYE